MIFSVRLYHFYRKALMRSIRLCTGVTLLFLLIYFIERHISPTIPLFLFNVFVMAEVFFHYKISKTLPSVLVTKNNGKEIYDSFTMEALYGFITEKKTSSILKKIVQYPQIKLILQRANISHKELVFTDMPLEVLAQSAYETAKTFKGTFVTTIDVFVAYLFLVEKEQKLLFAKQLKTEDLYNIVSWVRQAYPEEEHPKKLHVSLYGAGIGESLVSGWTPETKKYTADFTSYSLREEPLIGGREGEFRALLEGLVKLEDNNILLVGERGAGKETLVRALAYHSFEGNLGKYLNQKRVFQLLLGSLTAGATTRGDLEVRLQTIISEVSHSNDVMLYLPEFQNILGSSSYNLDLSGALLPYLKNGDLPIIATMTVGNYKTFMEKNPLQEVFTVIPLKRVDKNTAIQMVLGEVQKIEKKYRVLVSYRAIASAVDLSERFFQDEVLPGSALSLLGAVANSITLAKDHAVYDRTKKKLVLEADVVAAVEKSTHVAIAMPTEDEIQLLLHLEEKLHERVIGQDDAVIAVAEAMRRLRSGMKVSDRPLSFLFLGPTGVGKTETAKALASFYYGGEKNIIRLDMSEYSDETGLLRLLGAPPGQGQERGELTDKIHDNPSSLILLDEFEKAHPNIHNLFLQVLEDGRLTDNKGVTVSFQNAIIIATSNAGSEFIREAVEKGTKIDKDFQHQLLDFLQSHGVFKPELLNRFDGVITFKPLGPEQVKHVVQLLLTELQKTLAGQDISVTFDEAVVEKIAEQGINQEFGARPLRRYIQDNLEDLVAQKKLTKELVRGKTGNFAINGMGAVELTVA